MPGDELTAAREDLELLSRGDIELVGRMPWASNATLAVLVRDGTEELLAVYKPRRGERPLWDFPQGTLADREVAAYRVSEILGWRIVPPTVLRDGPLGPGMMQRFVEHDPEEHYLTMRDRLPDRFRRLAAFDAVVNNADRKSGHCLLDPSGHVWGVDHGVTFHTEPKLRTVIWDFAGEPLLPEVRRDLEGFLGELGGVVDEELGELLAPEEMAALAGRTERLLEEGVLPVPGGRHPYPWPYV